jgi:hypothetical protein
MSQPLSLAPDLLLRSIQVRFGDGHQTHGYEDELGAAFDLEGGRWKTN